MIMEACYALFLNNYFKVQNIPNCFFFPEDIKHTCKNCIKGGYIIKYSSMELHLIVDH